MKIKVNKNELFKGLTCCSSILVAKPIMQVLENVLMETHDDILKLRTTSLSSEIVYTIKLKEKPSEPFKCLIPCVLLMNTVKLIREEEIALSGSIKKDNKQMTLMIKSKKGQSTIQCQELEAFPEQKLKEEVKEYFSFKHINGVNDLGNALSFIQVEDIRPQLSCVSLELNKGILKTIGMSSVSGTTQFLDVHNSFDMKFDQVNVHKDILGKLFKLPLSTGLKFSVMNKMLVVLGDGFRFVGDTYDETKYPNVDSIYEKNTEDYIIINPREIKDSILRVDNFSEFTEKGAKLLNFDIVDGFTKLRISSENYAGSSEETNDINGENINFVKKGEKEILVKLNSVYLLSVLSSTQKPIKLYLRDISDQVYCKGLLFVSVGEVEGEEDNNESPSEKQFIVMPTI